ncbi:DUF4384 domain-containing protein [Deinococcus sp. Marseille-Q6407]|uniref:DUF4384 domain-containing protein n=1 Tax=Deinococcus sp. Marseille-Q6407 TaxID=2969223 RepID=UPI0021C0B111|nr:DUF4384 domain-containing protein [Deinococcus sp. Marseille-Q6407]
MNKTLLKAALLPMTLLAGTAGAQSISAQSIIVNPAQPDLNVQVSVDKDPTGDAVPTYRIGDGIKLNVKTNRDAYVYLFNVGADGEVNQILPNRLSGSNRVTANTNWTFPAANANFTYNVDGPAGLNKVLALASLTELSLNDLSTFANAQSQFANVSVRGQDNLAQALSIVVNPLPQNSWVSDTAFFDVAERAPVRTGNLFVGTNVNNAQVILNGRVLGSANKTYSGIAPGNYPVRIVAPGFADFRTTVTIRGNATTNLTVPFSGNTVTPAPVRPAPVNGTYNVTVRSAMEGGRVFLNGNEAGTIRGGQLTTSVERGQYQIVVLAPGQSAEIATVNVNRDGGINLSQAPRSTTINLLDLLFR